MSQKKSRQIPAQRRWLADQCHFHGKLSPMFELRELPGWFEEAHETPELENQSLTQAVAERFLEAEDQEPFRRPQQNGS